VHSLRGSNVSDIKWYDCVYRMRWKLFNRYNRCIVFCNLSASELCGKPVFIRVCLRPLCGRHDKSCGFYTYYSMCHPGQLYWRLYNQNFNGRVSFV